MQSTKTTAKVTGLLFLLAIFSYATGSSLIEPIKTIDDVALHVRDIQIGALLMLLNSMCVVGIGILMYPLLKPFNRDIALGYLSTRVVESLTLIVGIVSLLSMLSLNEFYLSSYDSESSNYFNILVTLALENNTWAYQIAMFILGIGSLFFSYLLYSSALIPKFLALLGMLGYALLSLGAVLELFGIGYGIECSVIGGVFEILFAFWLLFKGFNNVETT